MGYDAKDMGLYRYVYNNPTTMMDPFGLKACEQTHHEYTYEYQGGDVTVRGGTFYNILAREQLRKKYLTLYQKIPRKKVSYDLNPDCPNNRPCNFTESVNQEINRIQTMTDRIWVQVIPGIGIVGDIRGNDPGHRSYSSFDISASWKVTGTVTGQRGECCKAK
jgi:hypothetical protein